MFSIQDDIFFNNKSISSSLLLIQTLDEMLAFFLTPPLPPTRKHLQLTLKHIRSLSWITLDKYYRLSPQNIDINNPPCCSPRLFIPNSKSSSFGPVSSCAIVLLSCCLWSGVQFVYQDITHNVSVLDLPNISDKDSLNSNSSNIQFLSSAS